MLYKLVLALVGGVSIGFISALTGIGGGSLLVPYVVIFLEYDVKTAIATSLFCIIVVSSMSASVYFERKLVNLDAALLLEPLTALGAIVGAYTTISLPTRTVEASLGLLLLFISILMLRRGFGRAQQYSGPLNVRMRHKRLALPISFIAGMTSGMFGIGGGVIKMPLMTLVLGLPIKVAVATSSFMVGLTATSGGIVYMLKGLVDPFLLLTLAPGIILGANVGARYAVKVNQKVIALTFSLILLYMALRLIYTSLL